MNNFWLVLRKELTCCARDPDVLIYAVLLPLVLYPLSAVLVNEASLWYASMQEKNRDVVYVKGVSPLSTAIAEGLRLKKHFTVIDDNPSSVDALQSSSAVAAPSRDASVVATDSSKLAELKRSAIAVVQVDAATNAISIQAHETSSHLGTVAEMIEAEIREARFKGLQAKLQEKGLSTDILNVFTVELLGLKEA
ncbi:MAG: hypothetical protein U0103_10720 [Candidatus Obscuribacterales bacterium]